MKRIAEEIKQRIYNYINEQNLDAVVFVPPTISRKIQIITELKKLLKNDLTTS